MAQIIEDRIVITISRITKNNITDKDIEKFDYNEILETLESVAQELVGPNVIVEVALT